MDHAVHHTLEVLGDGRGVDRGRDIADVLDAGVDAVLAAHYRQFCQ